MGALDKAGLLKKEDLKIEKVDMGEGDHVYIRMMTGRERDRFDQSIMVQSKDKNGDVTYERNLSDFRAKLAASTLCDKEGNLLLEITDVPTLSKHMSAARLENIVTKAQALNKISEKDKDNLVKNSEGGTEEDSSSASV